jgi:protein TonB
LLAHDAGMVWVLDTAEYVEELYDEPTVAFPEIMSEYPGGESALRKFLLANMNYPAQAKDFGLEGTVYIKFTVSSAGVVKDVQIERGVDPLLDHEAIRVVSMMPDWIPAQQGIRKVATYIHLPVKFSLRK